MTLTMFVALTLENQDATLALLFSFSFFFPEYILILHVEEKRNKKGQKGEKGSSSITL